MTSETRGIELTPWATLRPCNCAVRSPLSELSKISISVEYLWIGALSKPISHQMAAARKNATLDEITDEQANLIEKASLEIYEGELRPLPVDTYRDRLRTGPT
jgi:hypothetical protein